MSFLSTARNITFLGMVLWGANACKEPGVDPAPNNGGTTDPVPTYKTAYVKYNSINIKYGAFIGANPIDNSNNDYNYAYIDINALPNFSANYGLKQNSDYQYVDLIWHKTKIVEPTLKRAGYMLPDNSIEENKLPIDPDTKKPISEDGAILFEFKAKDNSSDITYDKNTHFTRIVFYGSPSDTVNTDAKKTSVYTDNLAMMQARAIANSGAGNRALKVTQAQNLYGILNK